MVKIEGGCTYLPLNEDIGTGVKTYKYVHGTVDGDEVYIFHAQLTEYPAIGDFINEGVLVKHTELQINPDTHMWTQGRLRFDDENLA
jgi:hypothetical protein